MKNFIESENYTYNKMAETNLKTSSCNIEMMLNNLLIDTYKSFIEKLSSSIITQMKVINAPITYKKMLNYYLY